MPNVVDAMLLGQPCNTLPLPLTTYTSSAPQQHATISSLPSPSRSPAARPAVKPDPSGLKTPSVAGLESPSRTSVPFACHAYQRSAPEKTSSPASASTWATTGGQLVHCDNTRGQPGVGRGFGVTCRRKGGAAPFPLASTAATVYQ